MPSARTSPARGAVYLVYDEQIAQTGVPSGDADAGRVLAKLRHQLRRRSANRLAAYDGADGDAGSGKVFDGALDARHGQDGREAEHGVGRAVHQNAGGFQRDSEPVGHLGAARAFVADFFGGRFAAQFDEVGLEGQCPVVRFDDGANAVVAHRRYRVSDAQSAA